MRELVGLGVEIHCALPKGGPLFESYALAGIAVHSAELDFPVRRPKRYRFVLADMQQLVSEVAPDIIHSHFVGTTITMRLALRKRHHIPRIFQIPGPLHLEHAFFRQAEIATSEEADYWIGSCKRTCQLYRDAGIAPDRVFLSYYGTDPEQFCHHDSGRLRKELGLSSTARLVGMVAYLYPPKRFLGQKRGLKGHEDLIDAIALCLKANLNIVGVLVGGAWNGATSYEDQVREYAIERCGRNVILLGTRRDVPEIYPEFDVVVHPSHSENVGGAVESLLAGRPTIASAVGGLPDLVKPGETGWLVPPRRPDVLAKAILEVLSDPLGASTRAKRGQAMARTMFDVKRTGQQILHIYQHLMDRKSRWGSAHSKGI